MEIDEQLEPERARELIASNEVTVLDIRSAEEWRDKRIAGSQRVEASELESALEQLDDDRAVLVVCGDGKRSAEVASELREDGRDATCIEGGVDAWEKERLALQPSEDVDDDAVI